MNRWQEIIFLLVLLLPIFSFAQNSVRAKIDADRRYLNMTDEKTLEKAREFIRADSTFYIGYMIRGSFMYNRANDEHGFRQDIVDLEKAMYLIEKDYDRELRTRTSDIFNYIRVSNYQNDYCNIAYQLEASYQNIEDPGKAYAVVQRVINRNIQLEQGIESYNIQAWIFHRNRMYTPESGPQYAFLKNSVQENDSMAYKYLDSALLKIRNDAELNVGLFDASYLNRQYLYTYHYKAILFDYNMEIDSANFYYDELIRTGYYSSNNYAEFKMTMGEFPMAEEYFVEAEQRDGSREKQTREYFYMRGTLDIYKGKPNDADTLLRKVLDDQGSTPGYGWHSIGLARALHYEGLTAESQSRINKASNFHELHIATTWGQEQYSLACATLNYTNKVQFEQDFFFENDEWYFWLNPVNWWKYGEYAFGVNQNKLILAALVAKDPERSKVIYTLFSSENIVSFDEVWDMIDGFGNDYFIKVYKDLLEKDKRPKLKKYFRYFLGKLYLADGNEAEAIRYFQDVLNDPDAEGEFEKLLYARACEGMALSTSSSNDKDYWTLKMYETYPQLVPHSDLKMRFRLRGDVEGSGKNSLAVLAWISGVLGFLVTGVFYQLKRSGHLKVRPIVVFLPLIGLSIISIVLTVVALNDRGLTSRQKIIDGLQKCNITLTTDHDAPVVDFISSETKDATEIDYEVSLADGTLITSGSLRVPENEISDGGKLLAYRFFNIKKKKIGEEPEPVPPPKTFEKKKK